MVVSHRQPAPHPRLGPGRRRAGAHHPRRLPAARAARAPRRDRVGRHRRGVRPHVLVVRLRGDPHRQPPAGAAPEGPRGRRRPGGRLPAAGREAVQGRPGRGHRRHRRRRGRALRRRPGRPRASHALLAIGSIPNSEGLGPRRGRRRDRRRLRRRSTTTAGRTCRTSTPPATCPGSCRCRRWRRCRAARSPSTSWACTPGPPPPRLRQGGVGHLHRARDRRRRPGRGRRLRRGSQGPGHQGAVLGLGQGADQRRPARLREDRLRPGHRRGAGRVDRRASTPPS